MTPWRLMIAGGLHYPMYWGWSWESHSQPNNNPLLAGRVFPSSPSLRTCSPFDVFGAQALRRWFSPHHMWTSRHFRILELTYVVVQVSTLASTSPEWTVGDDPPVAWNHPLPFLVLIACMRCYSLIRTNKHPQNLGFTGDSFFGSLNLGLSSLNPTKR